MNVLSAGLNYYGQHFLYVLMVQLTSCAEVVQEVSGGKFFGPPIDVSSYNSVYSSYKSWFFFSVALHKGGFHITER